MPEARLLPGWLRGCLNLVAIIGVAATLMGIVQFYIGIAILVLALIYFIWEISRG